MTTPYHAIPPLVPVSVTGRLLGLSPATSYRIIGKTLPRAPISGKARYRLQDIETLIGRAITVDEYLHAVAKTKHSTNDAPDHPDTASLTEDVSHGSAAL